MFVTMCHHVQVCVSVFVTDGKNPRINPSYSVQHFFTISSIVPPRTQKYVSCETEEQRHQTREEEEEEDEPEGRGERYQVGQRKMPA